jgi:tetratricopeptide (TPR) repeat protein
VRTFNIRGSLRLASNNRPAEMIRVDLKKFTGETVNTTFTRANGDFEFAGLTSGNYVLEVAEEGYEPIRESVDVHGTSRLGVFLFLREPLKIGEGASTDASVDARELALSPRASEALNKGRHELFAKKNPTGSLKHFQKLAKEAPDFFEAHYYMGVAYADTGKLSEAEAELRVAIDRGESYVPSYVTLASILSHQNRFAEAEPLARKAIALEPAAWPGHFELARSLLGLNRTDDALQSARSALERKKDSADLHLLLANIHIRRRDTPNLLTALDSFLALRPEGPMSDRVRATRKQLLENLAQAGAAPPANQPPPL